MRSSALRRGDGTWAEVRRSIAALRTCRSCTPLFHHEDTGEGATQGCHWLLAAVELRSAWTGEAPVPTLTLPLASHYACGFLLHLLGLIVCGQRIDNRLQLAVHHLLKLMNGKSDTVIGQAVLREIVGANLF
jgi:hypothetical protein